MASSLEQWERAERERSAHEASQTWSSDTLSYPTDGARYVNPPDDTIHPLEYAFHLLGDVNGKTILEYGCGDGVNTVLLANRGAHVISLDLSPELIAITQKRLDAHKIDSGVDLIVGSAHGLPLPDESVDVVFGIAILHHLDLQLASAEVRRVLKKGGLAIFQEPVRNSTLLKVVRKLIPYRSPDVSPFERPLTDKELESFAADCSSYRSRSFVLPTTTLLNMIVSRIHPKSIDDLTRYDAALLRKFPALGYYSSVKVIEFRK
jgi:SAM-dependent methyltransferase